MVAGLVFQVVMLGLISLKGGLLQSLLLLPLLFLWGTLWAATYDIFRRPLHLLSLRAASDIDRQSAPVRHPGIYKQ